MGRLVFVFGVAGLFKGLWGGVYRCVYDILLFVGMVDFSAAVAVVVYPQRVALDSLSLALPVNRESEARRRFGFSCFVKSGRNSENIYPPSTTMAPQGVQEEHDLPAHGRGSFGDGKWLRWSCVPIATRKAKVSKKKGLDRPNKG